MIIIIMDHTQKYCRIDDERVPCLGLVRTPLPTALHAFLSLHSSPPQLVELTEKPFLFTHTELNISIHDSVPWKLSCI